MKNMLELVFLVTTILMGLMFSEKIVINENTTYLIYLIQVASLFGWILLTDMSKKYKIVLGTILFMSTCISVVFMLTKC